MSELGVAIAVALALAALAVAFVLPQLKGRLRRRREKAYVLYLQREYIRMLHMPKRQARATLARQLEALEEKMPGRPLAWYLEKLLGELERAKR